MIPPPPAEITGRFWAIVTFKAAPGKADEITTYLNAIRSHAREHEPGTLQYYPNRGVGTDSDRFVIIEQYETPAALEAHLKGEAILKLGEHQDWLTEFTLQYTEELP